MPTRLSDRGFTASRGLSYTFEGAASDLDTALAGNITHKLGSVPSSLELWVEQTAGVWEKHDPATYVLATATELQSSGTTLASVFTTDPQVRLVAAAGAVAVSVQQASSGVAGIIGSGGSQTLSPALTLEEALTLSSGLTATGNVVLTDTSSSILTNTTDGADTKRILIGGGGAISSARGAYLSLHGNEYSVAGGKATLIGGAGSSVALSVGGTDYLTVTSSGDVGIGTSSPASLLHLAGDNPKLYFDDTAGGSQRDYSLRTEGALFRLKNETDNIEPLIVDALGAVTLGPAPVAATNGVLHKIATGDQGTTLDFTTTSAGYVQFGNGGTSVMTPSIGGVTSDTNAAGLFIFSSNSNTQSSADMIFDVRQNNNSDFSTLTSDAYRFRRFGTSLGTVTRAGAWTLGPSGDYTPNHVIYGKINVIGDSAQYIKRNSVGSDVSPVLILGRAGTENGSENYIHFNEGATGVGNGTQAGGIRRNSGDTAYEFYNASDARLKDISGEMTGALAIVSGVPVKKYKWKKKEKQKDKDNFGFIAQDVQALLPEAVGVSEDGMLNLGKSHMFDVLWQAVRELAAKVETLEAAAP